MFKKIGITSSRNFISLLALGLLMSGHTTVQGMDLSITEVPGSPFTTVNNPQSGLCYSPNGKWLAVPNDDNPGTVSIYAVANDGALASVAGSPFTTNGIEAFSASYSPDNKFLLVGNQGTPATLSLFSVDQDTGILTQLDPTVGLSYPSTNTLFVNDNELVTIAYSPDGEFVAVMVSNLSELGYSGGGIVMYQADAATGALSLIGLFPSEYSLELGESASQMAFSPDGNFIAQLNSGDGLSASITIYSVDSSGVLGPVYEGYYGMVYDIPGAAVGTTWSLAYAPNGNVLAVSDTLGNIFTFTMSDGVPTFAAQISTQAVGPSAVAFSPDSQLMALSAITPNTITVFTVDAAGMGTQVGYPLPTGSAPIDLAFSSINAKGTYFLSAAGASNITSYAFALSLSAPSNVAAMRTQNRFLFQTDFINEITWSAPLTGEAPVAYNLYRDSTLTQFITTVPATSALQYYDHNRNPNVVYSYYIVSVDTFGNMSAVGSVSV